MKQNHAHSLLSHTTQKEKFKILGVFHKVSGINITSKYNFTKSLF